MAKTIFKLFGNRIKRSDGKGVTLKGNVFEVDSEILGGDTSEIEDRLDDHDIKLAGLEDYTASLEIGAYTLIDTGKEWHDGKRIYRVVITKELTSGDIAKWLNIDEDFESNVDMLSLVSLDTIYEGRIKMATNGVISSNDSDRLCSYIYNGALQSYVGSNFNGGDNKLTLVLEFTRDV